MRVAVWRRCECNNVGSAVRQSGRAGIDRSIRVKSGDRPRSCERDWDRRSACSCEACPVNHCKEWPGERGPRTLSESSRVVLSRPTKIGGAIE
jgi:hypothetical protein